MGDQVAILQYDLEYQNLLMCSMRGRAGQIVGQGFSGQKTQLGVKMSKTVKKVGSLNLKTLIEENKVQFCDLDIISELTTFISKRGSFKQKMDVMMTWHVSGHLWLGWLLRITSKN